MNAVEVFKTSVNKKQDAKRIVAMLSQAMIGHKVNFDLEDCDRILRVASDAPLIDTALVIDLLNSQNHVCQLLTD